MVFTIPSMAIPPQIPVPIIETIGELNVHTQQNPEILNYEDILSLVDAIEREEVDSRCSPEDLEKIAEFVAMLAREGTSSDDPVNAGILQQDVYTLLNEVKNTPPFFAYDHEASYRIDPAIYFNYADVHLCKKRSWFSEKCHSIGKFVRKHKKAIIIGAVVVVAAVVVTVAVVSLVGASAVSTAAVAAGTAAAAASGSNSNAPPQNLNSETNAPEVADVIDQMASFTDSSMVSQIVQEKTTNLKATLLQELDPNLPNNSNQVTEISLTEKARNLGSRVIHETLDAVADLIEPIPQLLSQIRTTGTKILGNSPEVSEPSGIFPDRDPLELHNGKVMFLHEKIDQAFDTDYAYQYTEESKATEPKSIFSTGILPPPGFFTGILAERGSFLEAGRVLDRGGLTKAGRALMKHGYRENSSFPKPLGNPEQVNEFGYQILEEIISDSKAVTRPNKLGGLDIFSTSGRGVRYDEKGNFIGFLEPPRNQ
jgi:hypothetical protein